MLTNLSLAKRRIILVALAVWLSTSIFAFASGRPELFAAMGSFSLCISFGVFLADRFVTQETRRQWDSQILTQSRMMWRYFQNLEQGKKTNDPTPINKLRDQITNNFDDLLAAKAAEGKMEHFRHELFFTVFGTLQWGFGPIIMNFFYQ